MKPGWVRIIAGKWRGRRLRIADVAGLRPTPDRVRETLFNWLAAYLPGAYCLDAFAGTGVLGFEALSRGAAHVVMIDAAAEVTNALKEHAATLQAEQIEIYRATLPDQLKKPAHPFDIVFLDPPYHQAAWQPMCEALSQPGYLADNALLYLEAEHEIQDNELPAHWRVIKSARAGQVFYHLVKRE